ncbi:MAG: SxtJ family membrane protein [Ignavibacteria bacterium]|nr:SxtJ family membrane protein [Ignavibacteria bacterium]
MNQASREKVNELVHRWSYSPEAKQLETGGRKTIWRIAYEYWMKFARALGKVNAFVLLTLVYFVFIGPTAIVLKILRRDLLDRNAESGSTYWYSKEQEETTLERSERQF